MIYAGGIKIAALFLHDLVEEVGDIEQAGRFDLAQLGKAAHGLRGGIDAGIRALDPQIVDTLAPSGAHPIDTSVALVEQLANLEQMDTLLDLRGYAGRVLINIEQAG